MSRSDFKRRERRGIAADFMVEESAGHRHQRLQDLVRGELEALLRDEVADPRLEEVRIAGVVLSSDYRHARVHYTIVRSADGRSTERSTVDGALQRAAPFLRSRLAEAVEMKRVPELRFVCDAETVP